MLVTFLPHQDFNAFARYISQFKDSEFPEFVSDLHVLVFMATLDIMPLRLYKTMKCNCDVF